MTHSTSFFMVDVVLAAKVSYFIRQFNYYSCFIIYSMISLNSEISLVDNKNIHQFNNQSVAIINSSSVANNNDVYISKNPKYSKEKKNLSYYNLTGLIVAAGAIILAISLKRKIPKCAEQYVPNKASSINHRLKICNADELKIRLSREDYLCKEFFGKSYNEISNKDIWKFIKSEKLKQNEQILNWETMIQRPLNLSSAPELNNILTWQKHLIKDSKPIGTDMIHYRGEKSNGTEEFTKRFEELKNLPIGSKYKNTESLWTSESLSDAIEYMNEGSIYNNNKDTNTSKILFEFLIPAKAKVRLNSAELAVDRLWQNMSGGFVAESVEGQEFIIRNKTFDNENNILKIWAEYLPI